MAERQVILDIQARTGDIKKRLAEINTALVRQSEDLRALNKSYKQGEITTEQYAQALAENKKQSAALRKEQRDLNNQIELGEKATKAATGSNEQLRAQLALLTREYNKLSKEEREATKEGQALQKQVKQVSDELKKNERAVGDNRREVGNYENALKGVSKNLIGGAGIIFGITTLSDAATRAARVFIDFEQKIATLSAISGATGEDLTALRDDAQRLGETTQFTASQVADLQTNFARVGFDTSQIIAATEATLNLAIATGEDLATSAEVAAFTLGGYGLSAEETARVTDVMAASFNASALNLERFQEATKLVSPISKTANVSIEATTAALGALADAGLTGSIAGTGLRNVLFELSDENSKLASKVGFSVKSSDDFIKALQVLKEQGIGTTEALELIDRRAVPSLLNLVENADKVEELTKQFENAEGAAQRAADTVGDTLQGDLFKAQSALEGVAIRIGDALLPALRSVVQGFTTFVGILVEIPKFVKENADVIGLLVFGLVTLNAQQIATAASTLATNAALRAQAIATNAAAIAQRVFNAALAANPIGLVLTLLAGLAAAFITAYRQSETFRAVVQGSFAALSTVITNFAEGVKGVLFGLGDIIAGVFTLDLDRIQDGFAQYKEGLISQTIGIGEGAGEAYNEAYNEAIKEGQEAAKEEGAELAKETAAGAKSVVPVMDAAGQDLGKALGDGVAKGLKASPAKGSIQDLEKQVRTLADVINNTDPDSPVINSLIDKLKEAQDQLDETKIRVAQLFSEVTTPVTGIDKALSAQLGAFEGFNTEFEKQQTKAVQAVQIAANAQKNANEEVGNSAVQSAELTSQASQIALNALSEDSKARKPILIGQAVADTYVAANRALASAQPPVSFILAGLSVAAGLANVANIVAQEFATGGIVGPGNISPRPNGDNVLATLTTGEVVLNADQQRRIGGPAVLAAAGVPGFAAGGLVGAGVETMQARQAATQQAQGQRIERQLTEQPAPVVTVKDISRVSNRVRVKDRISSI